MDLLIDLYKVNMYFEQGDKLERTGKELNQVKYNIIDMVKSKTSSVCKTIAGSLARY